MVRLRAPDGCPWDREQTHASLRSALLEECYEAIDAINRSDDPNLKEELGDLLLLVVMHAQMATERGAFQFDDIETAVCEKLIRRHPHVFGDKAAGDSDEVLRQWEQIKREEKGGTASILQGLPNALPALMRAQNAQKKAARVGFDWPDVRGALAKLNEELAELQVAAGQEDRAALEDEAGDLLFAAVNVLRKLHVESETALNAATDKFVSRFQFIESRLAGQGKQAEQCSLEELDALWDEAKWAD